MSNPNHDEETIDWLLDDYWERLNAGAPAMPADRALDPDLAATVHYLHVHDDAPGPDRAFVRQLRKELTMTTAQPVALSPRPFPRPASPNGWLPDAAVRPHQGSSRWRPALEIIAAAVLIVALIGGYAGSDRVRTGIHALLQIDDSSGPTAMLHGNPARTGELPGPGPEGEPALRWRESVGGENGATYSAPIVADGTIYITSGRWEGGRLITSLSAIDAATGQERWSTDVDGLDDYGSPAVAGGLIFIGTTTGTDPGASVATPRAASASNGALVAFDAGFGVERWRYDTGRSGYSSPAVVDGVVYIDSVDGSIHAVDAETGEPRWRTPLASDGPFVSAASPAVVDGVVYTASNMGVLYALDAATGDALWNAPTKGNVLQTPAVSDGIIYVAASKVYDEENAPPQNGWIYAFDASNGAERWSREIGNELYSAPAVADGKVIVATGPGSAIVAYDGETGDIAWTFATGDNASTSPTVVGGVVYAGSFDNRLYAIDIASGQERWRVELGGGVFGPPTVIDGVIFVAAGDGMLYAIGGTSVQPGTPVATPLADGDASGLPPCTAEPRSEWSALHLDGEPAASLVPVTRAQRSGQRAAAKEADLPSGPPADVEIVAAIKEMLVQANACHQRGRERELASFVSDDHLRRPWVIANLELNESYRFLWSPASSDDFDVDGTRVLPDGRIGVLIMHEGFLSGQFLVFVEQDGRWLLDEWIEVTETPEAVG